MATDKSSKESGTYPAGAEDLIEVRFDIEDDTVKGVIRTDSKERKKIVFASGDQPALTALGRRRPYDRERWVCRVLRDTEPTDPRRGALYVTLVTAKHLVFPLPNAGRLHVMDHSVKRLMAIPGMSALLQEFAQKFQPPSEGSHVTLDFGRTVGTDTRVPAPRIGYDEPGLFAMRPGCFHPSRVVKNVVLQGKRVSSVTGWFIPDHSGSDHWRLLDAVFGSYAPREPWFYAGKSEEDFKRSLRYWDHHAHLYDKSMGPTISATWRDAIEHHTLLKARFQQRRGGVAA